MMDSMFDGPAYSLADFVQDASAHAARIERDKTPEVLIVDGREALVVQDANAYQEMVQRLEKAEFLDSLRKALGDADAGKGRPAEDVFRELNAKYGF